MKIRLRIARRLLDSIRRDLERPHDFAAERIGVVYSRFTYLPTLGLIILAHNYTPVPDDQYVDDPQFGAVIGSRAIRDVIQHVYDHPVGAFHIHMHPGRGIPRPSLPDLKETAQFVPDFFHGRQSVPHGALILSANSISGRVWLKERGRPQPITAVRIVGAPTERIMGAA